MAISPTNRHHRPVIDPEMRTVIFTRCPGYPPACLRGARASPQIRIMARTPFLALLPLPSPAQRRSAQASCAVCSTNQQKRAAVSRRDFLIAARRCLGPSLRTAIPPRFISPRTEHPRVAIIVAGIAGLVAGYRLQQAVIPVRLYDARIAPGQCLSPQLFPHNQVANGEDSLHLHGPHPIRSRSGVGSSSCLPR